MGILLISGSLVNATGPKAHMKVSKHLMHWMSKGVKIYYVTGNHDEMLRKFVGFKMGSLKIVNKVILDLDNDKRPGFFMVMCLM